MSQNATQMSQNCDKPSMPSLLNVHVCILSKVNLTSATHSNYVKNGRDVYDKL